MGKRINYIEYLQSLDWLLKKNKLINFFLKRKWKIECFVCHNDKNLQVHHWDYDNIGKEKLSDLTFICYKCHKKWHKKRGFKEKWEKEVLDEIIKDYKNKIGIFSR